MAGMARTPSAWCRAVGWFSLSLSGPAAASTGPAWPGYGQGDHEGEDGEHGRELEGGRDAVGQDSVGDGARELAGLANWARSSVGPLRRSWAIWLAASLRLAVPNAVTRTDRPREPPTCW